MEPSPCTEVLCTTPLTVSLSLSFILRASHPSVPRKQKVLATNAQQPLAQDLEFDATANWQYAIDPATLEFSSSPPASGTLPSPIFDSGLTPLKITATACLINWAIAAPTFAASPPTNPACTGPATSITLTPYGVSILILVVFMVAHSRH